jgi:hypothetical protein
VKEVLSYEFGISIVLGCGEALPPREPFLAAPSGAKLPEGVRKYVTMLSWDSSI